MVQNARNAANFELFPSAVTCFAVQDVAEVAAGSRQTEPSTDMAGIENIVRFQKCLLVIGKVSSEVIVFVNIREQECHTHIHMPIQKANRNRVRVLFVPFS
jgi:hypothetical protein